MASADYLAGLQAAAAVECPVCAEGLPVVRDEMRGCSTWFAHVMGDGSRRTCWAPRIRRLMDKAMAPSDAADGAGEVGDVLDR